MMYGYCVFINNRKRINSCNKEVDRYWINVCVKKKRLE